MVRGSIDSSPMVRAFRREAWRTLRNALLRCASRLEGWPTNSTRVEGLSGRLLDVFFISISPVFSGSAGERDSPRTGMVNERTGTAGTAQKIRNLGMECVRG